MIGPFIAVIFLGIGSESPSVLALVAGLSIVAAAFALMWTTESLQFYVSQTLALALLAMLQVLPEYSFEVVLAWEGVIDLALASMTGANRLLLGLGWPVILFIAYLSSRMKSGTGIREIRLNASQSLEVFFLVVATSYAFIILAKGSIELVDAAVLIGIYALYIRFAARAPPENIEHIDMLAGPSRKIMTLQRRRKRMALTSLVVFGGFIILFGAEPFITSLRAVAVLIGLSQFLFIQWVAPFLSEFPESTSAFIWAGRIRFAPMAMANLISSKLNQWTLLIATIPIVYSLSLGAPGVIPLTGLQFEEVLLTAAQSSYGVTCLLDLRFRLRDAVVLFVLFMAQFLVPAIRLEVAIAYFAATAIELAIMKDRMLLFRELRDLRKHRASGTTPTTAGS